MAEERPTLRSVDWLELFPALRLFSALRMALNFRALVLAALALAGVAAGWRLCGVIFADPDDALLANQIAANGYWPWERPEWILFDVAPDPNAPWWSYSPVVLAWMHISAPFVQIFDVENFERLRFTHVVYLLSCALWSLLVWSFFGGAITRQAAVATAREENVSWGRLAGFVRSRLAGYFVAPLFPILGTFLAAAFLAVLGLVMRTEAGVLVGGLLWPFVLLGGFMMAFLLLGLFFAFPLMWGAVSAEGTDAFGALSHSYSYAYQRPLHYLFYVVLAAFIGILGWFVVSLFLYWIIQLTTWGISWGSGGEVLRSVYARQDTSTLGNAGSALVEFWNNCLRTLAAGYIFSYFWSASTVIYFLMRRLVDATDVDEVFMPDEQLHALPTLKTGPDGVPAVGEE
jgi:hypothetical protein